MAATKKWRTSILVCECVKRLLIASSGCCSYSIAISVRREGKTIAVDGAVFGYSEASRASLSCSTRDNRDRSSIIQCGPDAGSSGIGDECVSAFGPGTKNLVSQ